MGPASDTSELVSVLISLIVILGSLFLVALVLRRWRLGLLGRRAAPLGDSRGITIIAARTIGWQSSLQIVEAEGQRFLIGASRAGVVAIGRLDPKGSPGNGLGHPPAGGALSLGQRP